MAKEYVPYSGPVVTRVEAKAVGLKRFFTGVPCKHGHVAQRVTVNGACWPCANARTQAMYRGWAERNRDKLAANSKRYREAHPEVQREYYEKNRERHLARNRAQRKADPAGNSRAAMEWAKANPEAVKRNHRRWREANPDKVVAFTRNNRAMRALAKGKHTAAEVAEIIALQKGKCAYCRKAVGKSPHIDHITPLAKGGTNDRRNLQLTCAPCNLRKNRADPIAFAQRIGLLI